MLLKAFLSEHHRFALLWTGFGQCFAYHCAAGHEAVTWVSCCAATNLIHSTVDRQTV